ncbi:hypothetical protein J7444_00580 [Labrenzia sp. R4_1]|uniref:DNA primase family protein n=1 Tax=Labrenzia sp. R4_1 TaxID=2821106 RepID=UPI001ADAF65A|nr:phage/plasmid primase, P4 family [Labrenzia sp. R4_1]MBO9423191.1 hypothetical protein [Labrenzia sp. R4_1]
MQQQSRQSQADVLLGQLDMRFECSEVGNMERFVAKHKDVLRYIPERKVWATWDGSRWRISEFAEIYKMAFDTARTIYDEAKECGHDEGRRKLTNWAYHSQSAKRINTMIQMAAKNPTMTISISAFDTDPNQLNCLNGIVDLKTGELITHSSSETVMKQVPVKYHRHAKCPTFNRFLHDIFNHDTDLISWVQRAIGYTLTGLTSEQVFFLAYGTGANGKSRLFETVLDILGDYGRTSEFETFLASDKTNTRVMEGVAKLQGIRFALASETDSSRRFSEALVKQITGGDTVTGAYLYGGSFEFRPEFKLWLLANHLPKTGDGSHGFWRRVKVVPFARRFSQDQMDQRLREKLVEEAEGILAWCVRGAVNWHRRMAETNGRSGLGECSAVDEATREYRSEHDRISLFLETSTEPMHNGEVKASVLYQAYKDWCLRSGELSPLGNAAFAKGLKERNINNKRKREGVVYLGIRLTDDSLDDWDF